MIFWFFFKDQTRFKAENIWTKLGYSRDNFAFEIDKS